MNSERIVPLRKTMPARFGRVRGERIERERHTGAARIEAERLLRLFGTIDEIGRPAVRRVAGLVMEGLGELVALHHDPRELVDVMLVVLEVEAALVGGWAPILIHEISTRINEALGLRHFHAFKAVLDREPLGDAELVAGRLR